MGAERVSVSDKFVIFDNNEYTTYSNFDDIPEVFDKLITCYFEPLPEPHSSEDHTTMGTWNNKLQELKARHRRLHLQIIV